VERWLTAHLAPLHRQDSLQCLFHMRLLHRSWRSQELARRLSTSSLKVVVAKHDEPQRLHRVREAGEEWLPAHVCVGRDRFWMRQQSPYTPCQLGLWVLPIVKSISSSSSLSHLAADRPTGHGSVSTGCSTVRWRGGLFYHMPSPGPSCRGGITPASEPPCMGLCREESCLFSLAYCTFPHHTSSLQHLLSGLCTGQQEHKEPLRDVVEASRHHSSTGDTYRNSYYCQRSST
jgi:hypothetical protein